MKRSLSRFLVFTMAGGTMGFGALPPAQAGFNWIIEEVDGGTKPALALNSQGRPYITYMLERKDGWSKVARKTETGWETSTVDTGHFYGPPDITMNESDIPHDPENGKSSWWTMPRMPGCSPHWRWTLREAFTSVIFNKRISRVES